MIEGGNKMLEILAYNKQTENKFRWHCDVDGTPFEFYIPKWRVPEPCPDKISIKIYLPHERTISYKKYGKYQYENNLSLRNNMIVATVKKVSEHTKTIRFDPSGYNSEWEIGSPYIPYTLLPYPNVDELLITVDWF